MDFREEYLNYCATPSDINEHLPTLVKYGAWQGKAQSIVEFGVGYGRSTRAFLAAIAETKGSLNSYEMKLLDGVQELFDAAQAQGLDAHLHLGNLLELAKFETADVLLVDSHHTYHQVAAELTGFGDRINKFIIFHDTELYGLTGQDPGSVGIWPAINEFMDSHSEWKIIEQFYNNNGLLVIGKE